MTVASHSPKSLIRSTGGQAEVEAAESTQLSTRALGGAMGMNIKDPVVHDMARELAERRSTSVTDAVVPGPAGCAGALPQF